MTDIWLRAVPSLFTYFFSFSVPGPPSKVQFADISDRSVLVKWEAPEHQNGILTGYTVQYKQRDDPSTMANANLTADVTSYRINNLTVIL